jgi:hypothetical protein
VGAPDQGRYPALEVNDRGCPGKPDHLTSGLGEPRAPHAKAKARKGGPNRPTNVQMHRISLDQTFPARHLPLRKAPSLLHLFDRISTAPFRHLRVRRSPPPIAALRSIACLAATVASLAACPGRQFTSTAEARSHASPLSQELTYESRGIPIVHMLGI